MNPFQADYFDGKSARRLAATITAVGDTVVVAHELGSVEFALSAVRVQPQLKGSPRRIEFPDGSAAVSNDLNSSGVLISPFLTSVINRYFPSRIGY